MVRRHGVQGPVHQCGATGQHIGLRPQRWRHLGVRVVAQGLFVGQRQVVGGHFSRDVHTPLASAADCIDPSRRGHVGHVQVGPGELREHDVAGHVEILGDGGIAGQPQSGGDRSLVHDTFADQGDVLAVNHHGDPHQLRVLEHTSHHTAVHNRLAIVTEGHRPRLDQGNHLGHHATFEALGRCRNRIDPDR